MKIIRWLLWVLCALILLVVFVGVLYISHLKRSGVPDYNKDIHLSGLIDTVEVLRDSTGVPHVIARNERDLYMAVGYLVAQDRLWQMDLLRRVTTGRLAEIFGKGFVDKDQFLRALRYSEKSRQILDSCNAGLTLSLTAFSEGVNQYIKQHRHDLPFEFNVLGYQPEPWEPVHSLNLIGYMAWDLESGWSEILLRDIRAKVGDSLCNELIPKSSWYKNDIYPASSYKELSSNFLKNLKHVNDFIEQNGLEVFQGSNNWAVSGARTATGKPLLANDMHLGFGMPGIWYQMHQVIPGKLDVTGLVLPGEPLVVVGHNDSIAWGMTNAYVENVDFYLETINPDDTDQYKFNGSWRHMKVQKEEIRIKKEEPVIRVNRFTRHGAVVSGFKHFGSNVVSMHWAGDEYSNEYRTIYLLNRAHNWQDLTRAVTTFLAVSQNIVYADVKGNIGLFYAAGIPIRKRSMAVDFLPGDTDEYDWKGFVPTDDLPRVYNPPEGFVASANNRPVGDDYPYYIGRWYSLPCRYNRIRELLMAGKQMTSSDFVAIQTDQHSKLAEAMVPGLVPALENMPDRTPLESRMLDSLRRWHFDMSATQVAPLIFEETYQQLIPILLKDEMGDSLFKEYYEHSVLPKYAVYSIWLNPSSRWCDDITTPGKRETLPDDIRKAFRQAVSRLSGTLGNDPVKWEWGDVHTLTLEHPLSKVKVINRIFSLSRGPYAVGGSYHTVRPYSYSFGNRFHVVHGASHRHIFDLSDWDRSLTVIPTGNSGVPASRFYGNQTELYVNDRYHPDLFSLGIIEKSVPFRIHLIPEK